MSLDLDRLGREFCKHSGYRAGMLHTVRRAIEEMMELQDLLLAQESFEGAGETFEGDEAADEIADVILTLLAGAAVYGFTDTHSEEEDGALDVEAAVLRKHARNMSAEWIVKPNGCVKRVKT